MNKKSNTPRRKRFNKQARLNSARSWIKDYSGKNIISGYAKWFGVDKLCAMRELKIVGVEISEDREKQIKESVKANIEQKQRRKAKKEMDEDTFIESDENFAFIVGYTSGGFPYGLTHEEYSLIEAEDKDLGKIFDS